MLRSVDAAQALADLTEISSQVVHVAIVEGDGRILATTIADESIARSFAAGVTKLVEEAGQAGSSRGLVGLAQFEAASLAGSVFVVRRGARVIAATTRPDPTVGLVFYDLKHCLQSIDEPRKPNAADAKEGRMAKRRFVTGMLLGVGSLAGSVLYRRRAARLRERVDLYAEDGSMVSIADNSAQASELLSLARELIALTTPVNASLAAAIREAAYLEGDFLLRSGKRSSYYLDKYRFGTKPELLGPLGAAIAAAVRRIRARCRTDRRAGARCGLAFAAGGVALRRAAVRDRQKHRKGLRHLKSHRGRVCGGRARVRGRGRGHVGGRRDRRDRGSPRGRTSCLSHGLRRRSRRGRRRRSCAESAVRLRPLFRASELPHELQPEAAWLSDIRQDC